MFSGTHFPTEIAVNTDFLCSTGSPEPHLRAIAEAGFTHLHWCHQWNTDFLYSRSEWAQYARWFHEFDLKLLDIHGSQGVEKCWHSPVEYERQAGVELVVKLLAGSSYKGRPLSFELSMRYTPFYEGELERNQRPERIHAFLSDAYERCRKVVEMFEQERARMGGHSNES